MRLVLGLFWLLACLALPAIPAAAHGTVEIGTFGVLHKDGFGKGATEFDYTLTQGNRTLEVLPTQLGSAGHGDRVEVHGKNEAGRLVGRVAATDAAGATDALDAAEPRQRSLAVVLLNWASDQREPWTPGEVHQQIFGGGSSMNAFFEEESYDQISFAGEVLGWYTISAEPTNCNNQMNTWTPQAIQAASADGINLYGYDHVMFVFPESDCSFAGAGHVGGPYSWINGTLSTRITAHEMGHNLGLHHANAYACTDGGSPVTISDNCESQEYGDPFDIMGSDGAHHNHGWHLERLGVLSPSNVQTITESGTYTMRSALTQTSEPTTLRIPRTYGPGDSVLDYYYLEVRERGGVFDGDFLAFEPVVNGVTIRLNDDPSVTSQSRLLKATPGGYFWRWEAPFPAGSSFSDAGIEVGVSSAADGEATVAITVPDRPDTEAPTVPTGVTATATADGVELSWTSSTDDRGVTSYAVYRDGAEIGTTATPGFTDTTVAPGAHAYVVAAEDAAHNRSGLSAPATVNIPAPTVPNSGGSTGPAPGGDPAGSSGGGPAGSSGGDPAGGSSSEAEPDRLAPRLRIWRKRGDDGRLRIRIRATDARAVGSIELFMGGKRRKSVRLSSSSSVGTLRYVGRIPRGARSAVARATDLSGNRAKLRFRLPRS